MCRKLDALAKEDDTAATFTVPQLQPTTVQSLASRKVQKAWRTSFQFRKTVNFAKKLVEDFKVTSENARLITFKTLTNLLRHTDVIAATKSIVQRIHLLCVSRHGTEDGTNIDDINVRVVLAAFMIVHRPSHVFEIRGELVKNLIDAGTKMLANLEGIIAAIMQPTAKHFQSVPASLTKDFQAVMHDYLVKFNLWKIPDEAKLTLRIRHALWALYQAKRHLPSDEREDSHLAEEFNTQINRLRAKMISIGGQAALDQLDAEQTQGGGNNEVASGRVSNNSIMHELLIGRMSNHRIAHELLIDPLFQLTENGGTSDQNIMFQRVRDEFHRAFWESLVDDVRLSPPCYARVIRVLDEIRNGISDLSESSFELAQDVLDTSHIQAKIQANAFEWDDSKKLIQDTYTIITRIQAPRRDEETEILSKEVMDVLNAANTNQEKATSFTKALEFLLNRVNICRIDAANSRLRLIAPVIQDHGFEYEGGKFQRKLDDNEVSLDNTKQWISAALKSTIDIASKIQDGVTGSIVDAHTTAITLLVDGSIIPDASEANLPETLVFDVARIAKMRSDFRDIIKANIVLTIATSEVKSEAELEKVYACFDGLGDDEELDPTVFATSDALKTKFDSVIHENSEVYKLLRTRLTEELRANALVDTPRVISISSMPKVPEALTKRTTRLINTFRAVSKVNRLAHKKIYDQIVPEIAREVCSAGI